VAFYKVGGKDIWDAVWGREVKILGGQFLGGRRRYFGGNSKAQGEYVWVAAWWREVMTCGWHLKHTRLAP
jgi:hypothetical protein